MEESNKRGGVRVGAGRKPVADEQKVNALFTKALKTLYKSDTDEDAKLHFINKVLLESQRGQIFIAEHIFGKPVQTIDQNNTHNFNNFDIKEVLNFDNTK